MKCWRFRRAGYRVRRQDEMFDFAVQHKLFHQLQEGRIVL